MKTFLRGEGPSSHIVKLMYKSFKGQDIDNLNTTS